MGTYLFPVNADPQLAERLAGCQPGTSARLEALRAEHERELAGSAPAEHGERRYHHWLAINADRDLAALDRFETFGFGRLGSWVRPLVESWGMQYHAGTVTGDRAAELLAVQHVDLPEGVTAQHLEGLWWG